MKIDYVIKAMAELIDDYETVYVGLNSIPALLGAFLARDMMDKEIRIIGVAEADNPKSILLSPSTGDPFFLDGAPVMITADSFDLAQKGELDVMFLGPAQIDQETNVNLSAIGDFRRPSVKLPGGAATAYLMPLANKLILWNLKHSKNTLVNRVDFVTGTAKYSNNKVFLVTNLAVLRFDRERKKWMVKAVMPWATPENIIQNTGFPVEIESTRIVTLYYDEIEYLDMLDPSNLRTALEF